MKGSDSSSSSNGCPAARETAKSEALLTQTSNDDVNKRSIQAKHSPLFLAGVYQEGRVVIVIETFEGTREVGDALATMMMMRSDA